MSRPAGSKNKQKHWENELTKYEIPNAAKLIKPEQDKVHYDAIFGIRAFRTGQWKGLWELVKISNDGTRRIVVDATSRGSMINLLNRECMKIIIGA